MRYLFLLITITLVGCSTGYETHCMLADKFVMNFTSKLQKTDKLRPTSYGGAMMDDIQKINLGFETEECMNLDQMRKFIVLKAEEFLAAINNDLEIRPYLHDYPCTINNIQLSISYNKKGKSNAFYPHVANAQIYKGEILYITFAEESDWFITSPPSEPYERALQIINEESALENCNSF